MKLLEIDMPEYRVDTTPNHLALGKKVDDLIKRNFVGERVVVRGVASSEHPQKTIDELIEIIQRTGTDRYDSGRAGDRYENVEGKHIDLFAFPVTVTENTEVFQHIVWGFYHSAIGVHGRPMRIDIVTVYDAGQMEQVVHQYEGRDDIKDDGFVFKDPESKASALLGIIKISP